MSLTEICCRRKNSISTQQRDTSHCAPDDNKKYMRIFRRKFSWHFNEIRKKCLVKVKKRLVIYVWLEIDRTVQKSKGTCVWLIDFDENEKGLTEYKMSTIKEGRKPRHTCAVSTMQRRQTQTDSATHKKYLMTDRNCAAKTKHNCGVLHVVVSKIVSGLL